MQKTKIMKINNLFNAAANVNEFKGKSANTKFTDLAEKADPVDIIESLEFVASHLKGGNENKFYFSTLLLEKVKGYQRAIDFANNVSKDELGVYRNYLEGILLSPDSLSMPRKRIAVVTFESRCRKREDKALKEQVRRLAEQLGTGLTYEKVMGGLHEADCMTEVLELQIDGVDFSKEAWKKLDETCRAQAKNKNKKLRTNK
jgi:hypothetical protein